MEINNEENKIINGIIEFHGIVLHPKHIPKEWNTLPFEEVCIKIDIDTLLYLIFSWEQSIGYKHPEKAQKGFFEKLTTMLKIVIKRLENEEIIKCKNCKEYKVMVDAFDSNKLYSRYCRISGNRHQPEDDCDITDNQ